MDNVNSKDIENYAKKIDEKYADKGEDKMGYQEFKSAYTDAVEKSFHYKGMSDVEIDKSVFFIRPKKCFLVAFIAHKLPVRIMKGCILPGIRKG